MSKTIGYIVIGSHGFTKTLKPELVPIGCRKGVLQNGGATTLFKTRQRAKSAIRRTKQYAKEKGYEDNKMWVGNLRIQRVEGESE